MSMTNASNEYFARVAEDWDTIRAGYFSETVRENALRKAFLRPEMVVADIGAGTGFISAELAARVRQVYVIDGSAEMLAVAQQKLGDHKNLIFRQADGLDLPLEDNSLDAAFANMYLHHVPEPLEAIREMVRTLKPGGRLVISDMDAHPFAWLKDEMADVWQGFEREQMRTWLREAGLVNIIVDCSGESCSAESSGAATAEHERKAEIGIFLAVGSKPVTEASQYVADHYGAIAESGSSCCAPKMVSEESVQAEQQACCSTPSLISLEEIGSLISEPVFESGYKAEELSGVPGEAAELSLGCGNPTALAGLKPGEVVLDIGSGAGLDAFLAARQVGETGKVIGVDMTPAMLERARRSAEKAGLSQVEFRQGHAEALPVEDASVDVIISNCVINLTLDKGVVFAEAYRALRPGGRLEVSDMVTDQALLPNLVGEGDWGGCVIGALPEAEYVDLMKQAGFQDVRVQRSAAAPFAGVQIYSALVSARK